MSSTRNMRDVNKNNQPASGAQAPRLPALPINKLTQGQLKAVVPGLMQLATNSSLNKDNNKVSDLLTTNYPSPTPSSPQNNSKENITTDLLRLMVRNCYRQLGQEELLTDNNNINWKSALATLSQLQSNFIGLKKGSRLGLDFIPDILSTQGYNKSFIEIYLCFFCSEEFGGKEELKVHQNRCSFRPPELRCIRSPSKSPATATESSACPQLSPLWPTESGVVISHSREDYMQGLDLLPVQKAIRIREKRRNTEVELDVDKFVEPVTPKSPGTPRTPKSLISQLSRDGESSACKRRLSYLCPRDNSDADSVVSNSSSDDEPHKPSKTLSLLFIDVASPLGQKVQKCVAAEPDVHTKVLTNPEWFCRTPVKDPTFSEKLRVRNASIPVTYKLTRKRIRQFNHTYKFTKSEREFSYDYIRTGLNKGSRMLKKSLPRCKVPLKRLTMSEFKRWKANPNPPKVPHNWRAHQRKAFQLLQKQKQMSSNQPCSFPNGPPVLLGPGIDRLLGLRKKEEPKGKKSSLTLTNVLSEDANAEMSQLKLSLYKSLLTELSDYQEKFPKTKAPNLPIPHLQGKSSNHQTPNSQQKHYMSSPIRDQLNQKAAPVFLSPCRVDIQQLERDQNYSPPQTLSPPSSTNSAKTKSGMCATPLSIHIPKDNFKPTSGSNHKSRRDLYNDIDNLTSDDSISIRTGSSDDSYKCLSPEEEPCERCQRYLCKCKSKALKSFSDKTPEKKRKVGRPRNSKTSNRNLSNNKTNCSREIVKKYRRNFSAKKLNYSLRGVEKPAPSMKIPKYLQIDMKESAFIPAAMLCKTATPKKLAIDMEWKPSDSKSSLRQRNSVEGRYTEDHEATSKPSSPKQRTSLEGKDSESTTKPSKAEWSLSGNSSLRQRNSVEGRYTEDHKATTKPSKSEWSLSGNSSPRQRTSVDSGATTKPSKAEWSLSGHSSPRQRTSVDGKHPEAMTKPSKAEWSLSGNSNPKQKTSSDGRKAGKGESSTSVIDSSSDEDDTPLIAICQSVTQGRNKPTKEKEPRKMDSKDLLKAKEKTSAVNTSKHSAEKHQKVTESRNTPKDLRDYFKEKTIQKNSSEKQIVKDLKKEKDPPKVVHQLTNPREPVDIASYIRPKIIMRKHPFINLAKSQTFMSPPESKAISISPEEPFKKKLKMPKGLEIDMVWQPEDLPARRESKPKPDELTKSESELEPITRERSATVTAVPKEDDTSLRQRSLSIGQALASFSGNIVEASPSSLKKSATLPANSPMKWVKNTNLHFHPGGEKQKKKSPETNVTYIYVSPPSSKTLTVQTSPTVQKSPAVSKSSALNNLSGVEKSPAVQKSPTVSKSSALNNLSGVSNSPAAQKSPTVSKSSALNNLSGVSNSPAAQKSPTVSKSSALNNLSGVSNSPAAQKSPTVSKSSALNNLSGVEKSPAAQKSPTVSKSSALNNLSGVEKSPAIQKSTAVSKSSSLNTFTAVQKSPTVQKSPAVIKSPMKNSSSILKLPLSVKPVQVKKEKISVNGSPKKATSGIQGGFLRKNSSTTSTHVKQNKSVLPSKVSGSTPPKKTPGSPEKVPKSILSTPSGSPKKVTDKSAKKLSDSSSPKKSMSENTAPASPKKTKTSPKKSDGSPSKKISNTTHIKSPSPKKDSSKKSKAILMPSKKKKLSIQSYEDFLMEVETDSPKSDKSTPKSTKTSPKMKKTISKKSPFGSKVLLSKKAKSKAEDKSASLTAASLLAGARGTKRKISLGKVPKAKKLKTKE